MRYQDPGVLGLDPRYLAAPKITATRHTKNGVGAPLAAPRRAGDVAAMGLGMVRIIGGL